MTPPKHPRSKTVRVYLDGHLAPRWYAVCDRCGWWNWTVPGQHHMRTLRKLAREHEKDHTAEDLVTALLEDLPAQRAAARARSRAGAADSS